MPMRHLRLRKFAVLAACDTAAKIISDGPSGRCATALADVPCLRDPFSTCAAGANLDQLNFVAGVNGVGDGDGAALFTAIKTNRLAVCATTDYVNSQKSICRTDHPATAACLRNPFGTGCNTHLSTAHNSYRQSRIAIL